VFGRRVLLPKIHWPQLCHHRDLARQGEAQIRTGANDKVGATFGRSSQMGRDQKVMRGRVIRAVMSCETRGRPDWDIAMLGLRWVVHPLFVLCSALVPLSRRPYKDKVQALAMETVSSRPCACGDVSESCACPSTAEIARKQQDITPASSRLPDSVSISLPPS
jgi:hypothetical protein